jgi:CubicO group peptidase (beta-lactamase class C family)
MHRMRVFLFALLVPVVALAQSSNDEKIAEFRSYAEQIMKAQQMPGLSVAVRHGGFRWEGGFGFGDVENQVPATAASSYRMGSVSKPMTALAILKLADEGKLDLDAEVQTYVSYFPRKPHPVTIRQLLAHQGGISHYRDYEKEGRIKEPKTTREAIGIFADFDLINEPGTKYSYTSYGFNLLGAVIEEVSRQPYGAYLAENVWKPLGMTSTRMDDPRAIIPYRVDGYVLEDGTLRRSEYVDISSRFGGGGARSTVGDMIRLIEGVADGKVLKAETRERAWSMQPTRDQHYTRYGYGFSVGSRHGRYVVGHTGAQQETRTSLIDYPNARFTVALASNFENADLSAFEEKLVQLFLGDPRRLNWRAANEQDAAIWQALDSTYANGLAYYDRYGRAMTTDARELAQAFRYLRDAMQPNAKLVADGAHPVAGEPFVKVGSYIASVLAARGDVDRLHRDGVLRFFAEYAASALRPRLDRNVVTVVREWSEEWSHVATPALRSLDFYDPSALDVLERERTSLIDARLRPDYERDLLGLAERSDAATARRALTLGVALYPESKQMREGLARLPAAN